MAMVGQAARRSFQFRLVNRNSIVHIEIRTYNLIKTCELFIKNIRLKSRMFRAFSVFFEHSPFHVLRGQTTTRKIVRLFLEKAS